MKALWIVALVLVFAGCAHKKPKPIALPTTPPTEAEAQALLDRVEGLVKKKKYDEAIKIYDEAAIRFKDVPIEGDAYSNFGGYLSSLKTKAECLKRRDPEKRFKKKSELQKALRVALEKTNLKELSAIFSCHTMIGVPYSEFDEVYNPERLAEEIIKQRGQDVKMKGRDHGRYYLTSGYTDGGSRLFVFEDHHDEGWGILGIVVGDAETIDKMLADQDSGQ